jgi:pyruvate/2-oxoglutarate dehydrogenase complex dihydrolipoamide dehydrogenase (E3) component/membrane protein DedA with SNARE-associated domain
MTLAGGAVFGLAWGTLIVSFASSLGATLAFLLSRFVLREWVQRHFAEPLRVIDAGVEREGGLYLFTLRVIPAVPFFVINVAMGLTRMRTWTFYWVSQLGMLAGTLVYVNAGTQLGRIDSARGLLTPGLIGAFVLLGIFPYIAKRVVDGVKARKVLARWPRPRSFDRNLVVIGAGAAGLVSAYIAATVKAKVTLIERGRMGGDCLNTGCIPSKALLRTAKMGAMLKHAGELGYRNVTGELDFPAAMERVRSVIRAVEPHDSVERYTALGVECLQGEARITSPYTVEVTTPHGLRTLTTRAIVIAAGAEPTVPPIPGIADIGYLTSETVWNLRALPRRMIVLGGGPIGCELAQCYARLGAAVTQVEMLPRLMMREDPDISGRVAAQFRSEGITVLLQHAATRFAVEGGEKVLYCTADGKEVRIAFDEVLCAVGRTPRTQGYGLEALGIGLTKTKTIEVDEFLQTIYPNIYVCGDAAGPYQFTHTAAHTAWYAAVNALFGRFRKFRADFSVIPWATFVDPEVARVGLNETEARERNIPYELTVYDLADSDRAIADGAARGVVKVLTARGKDRILGATIVGEHAGDLIVEFIVAMRHGIGLNKILGTIHIYPTLAEANKYAAGNWKRAHAPRSLLKWAERYHAWRRN